MITKDECELIKHRIKYAAEQGFELEINMMRTMMGRIDADGQIGYSTAIGLL